MTTESTPQVAAIRLVFDKLVSRGFRDAKIDQTDPKSIIDSHADGEYRFRVYAADDGVVKWRAEWRGGVAFPLEPLGDTKQGAQDFTVIVDVPRSVIYLMRSEHGQQLAVRSPTKGQVSQPPPPLKVVSIDTDDGRWQGWRNAWDELKPAIDKPAIGE